MTIEQIFSIGLAAASLAALSFICKAQGKFHLIQYLYFLRIPVGTALLMLSFPFLLLFPPVEKFARNWFDLDFVDIAVVTALALTLAWVVMNRFLVNYLLTAPRNHLLFSRAAQQEVRERECDPNRIGPTVFENRLCPFLVKKRGPFPTRFYFFSLLAAPLIVVCYLNSSTGKPELLGGIAVGLIVASGLWFVWQKWVKNGAAAILDDVLKTLLGPIGAMLRRWLVFLTSEAFVTAVCQGYERQSDEIEEIRHGAFLFFLLSYGAYVLAYFLLAPDYNPEWTEGLPALGYILLFLILVVWFLPLITLFLDKFRIPTVTSIVILSLVVTKSLGSDYFYVLHHPAQQRTQHGYQPREPVPSASVSYKGWQNRHPGSDRAIIITASGGGISAAYWTSLVITELEKLLGPKFSSSVLLISSTSGGSIGAMHIVARYDKNGLRQDKLDDIVRAAGSSSLGASAWGLVYPDFWRSIIGYSFLSDRAWAQEQIWEHYLSEGNGTAPIKMSDWRDGIIQGWRPVSVFNATIAETGEQLYISPIDLFPEYQNADCRQNPKEKDFPRKRGLVDLYPGADINVTTAARLSAAFPIVTPTARPELPDNCKWQAFHIGDGGYFDNYGTLAAIEYLEQVLPEAQGQLKKVLVLQIRSSSTEIKMKARTTTSSVIDLFAPMVTMYNVRGASQLLNNEQALIMQVRRWNDMQNDPIEIIPFTITLEQDTPLSWYLSDDEKRQIRCSWTNIYEKQTKDIATFLGTKIKKEYKPEPTPKECKESQR